MDNKKISSKQAEKLIELARESISCFFKDKEINVSSDIKKEFSVKRGVFVTINIDDSLRGCIGFPEPVKPLYEAVIEAGRSAAFEDPRFSPLTEEEFSKIKIELSVLTKPEIIKVSNTDKYKEKIHIGKDGLMLRDRFGSGLLLPQVASEQGWDAEEFLSKTCVKAGIDPDSWKDKSREVYKFQAQVFSEEQGKVVEKI